MECETSDSKKLVPVFEVAKRRRNHNEKERADDTISGNTDDSSSLLHGSGLVVSGKASLPDIALSQGGGPAGPLKKSRSRSVSPDDCRGSSRTSRRHRCLHRNGVSLALKAGVISSPRSPSPQQEGDCIPDISQTQDIYSFFEDEIKKDKRKQRHARRQEEQRERNRDHYYDREWHDRDRDRGHEHECSRDETRDHDRHRDHHRDHHHDRHRDRTRDRDDHHDRDRTPTNREHRHRHRRRCRDCTRERDRSKEKSLQRVIDQALLIETFAKLCSTITEKSNNNVSPPKSPMTVHEAVGRTQSHKSLQCEVVLPVETYDIEPRPVRQRRRSDDRIVTPRHVRSYDHVPEPRAAGRSPTRILRNDKYSPMYEKGTPKYTSKVDIVSSKRDLDIDRPRDYQAFATRSSMDQYYRWDADRRDYRECDDGREPPRGRRSYEDEKRRFCEQKTSRSFDVPREVYEDDERYRQTARSDSFRKRNEDLKYFRDRRYDDRDKDYERRREKYYDAKHRDSRDRHSCDLPAKDRRSRRNIDRLERVSVVSREDEKDRFSERERDSGLSIADGDTSTVSCRSNYLKVVKQEIVEQREAMDKMMKLWKELMRCFKGMSQTQAQDKAVHESAATVQESAAAQLRLWRECMRRYETVARDVGDTDARLMDEISKQRSEMAEMATMWQECLQRYRDISSDFNSLKKQLATESPSRPPPLVCAEGEGSVPAPPYRLPPNYPPPPPMGPIPSYGGGSPLRSRASAPPAWWWLNEQQAPPTRRRSSPDSRGSRSRDRRHRRKERDNSRNKEKSSSKQGAARSEHRHRKR